MLYSDLNIYTACELCSLLSDESRSTYVFSLSFTEVSLSFTEVSCTISRNKINYMSIWFWGWPLGTNVAMIMAVAYHQVMFQCLIDLRYDWGMVKICFTLIFSSNYIFCPPIMKGKNGQSVNDAFICSYSWNFQCGLLWCLGRR